MMRSTYNFSCPVCRKSFRMDEPGEPCCTGPNETLDEHPLTVMRLTSIDKNEVAPQFAERRANGPLIVLP